MFEAQGAHKNDVTVSMFESREHVWKRQKPHVSVRILRGIFSISYLQLFEISLYGNGRLPKPHFIYFLYIQINGHIACWKSFG